ncbi:choice-of-anchor I family protein [Glycomyces albidus]|uniref:choice-of-anchor I family protein n=1 Tax=Glycomyces albidus TaxID=2656774 RepID=UPI002AD2B19C|nr:choice-of-anchor I family protein [Glycomyces albidus]
MQKRLLVSALAVGLAALAVPAVPAVAQDDPALDLSVLGTYATGVFAEGAAEIVAYDAATERVFAVNAEAGVIDVIDVSDPAAPVKRASIDAAAALGQDGATVNSVAVSGGKVAAAVEAPEKTDPGWVAFFDTDGAFTGSARVGAQPDSVAFTPDGSKAVTADEGEPNDDYTVDPAGTVSVVDAATFAVATADFTAWTADTLPEGVRVFGPDLSAADAVQRSIEPEYVTVADDATAYVTLQENNAIAVVDLDAGAISEILPLGTKDHSAGGAGLDASDEDGGPRIEAWPVRGMYLPDGVDAYASGGETYLVTANEGDVREWGDYSEEARVEDLELCEGAFGGADLAALQAPEALGRLKVTTTLGATEAGCHDALYSFGGRSFSIWSADGELVFDSGDAFEATLAAVEGEHFNADNEANDADDRSDDKGPEPEAVAVGQVGDRMYAFIGLERQGGIMVYDVTDPADAVFVDYVSNRDFAAEPAAGAGGDLGPESIAFIAAADSPTGSPMLAVGNEVSGTTTLWGVTGDGVPGGEPGGDPSATPSGSGVLPKTGTGATGLLVGLAALLAVGGGVLAAMRRRAA